MTRVLFIDDEPIILRSLDRALRARKVPWDVRFVDSSTAALQLLAREPFDIVIADLRIPDLDGVELLTEVQRAYPRIARLVLSGQVGTDDCLRAMRVAHQCLAKPCDVDMLKHVVTNLAWTRTLVDDAELATSANELNCLPSPPRVHVDVCAAIARNAALPEIAHIIDGDVALTAKLIQVVNSAFFAQGGHVTSVQRALTVLGTDVVRGLLLHVEVFRAFDGADAKRIEQLSRHAKLVAQIARTIAPRELAGDAFVAGMLHDAGELASSPSGGRSATLTITHAPEHSCSGCGASRRRSSRRSHTTTNRAPCPTRARSSSTRCTSPRSSPESSPRSQVRRQKSSVSNGSRATHRACSSTRAASARRSGSNRHEAAQRFSRPADGGR
jgi:DNA-binding NarL/FixJ family response regulator